MSRYFVELFRKTASRFSRHKPEDEGELSPLQQTRDKYSLNCYSLYQACVIGDVDAVRWYINVGQRDVNKPDKNECTALFYCIQKDNIILVKDLINAGANINQEASLEEGVRIAPVHLAAKYDRRECLKILLENGADANAANEFGQTPLHTAARRKLNDITEILIMNGNGNINAADHDNVTPLHLAATPGNDDARRKIVNTMLKYGANPFSRDSEGNTVFHEAAKNNADDVLEILCAQEDFAFDRCQFSSIADVLNTPGNDGNNCLHLAVKYDHEKVIKLCIDNKADINRKTNDGDTPLHIACCKGNVAAVRILLENGADINATDKFNNHFIHRAAARGNIGVCELLLEMGANLDAYHLCGTALVQASRYRRCDAVKFLLDKGATPTMRDVMLDTCLHHAVKNGDINTVKVIMEECGRELLELRDKNENTTLHLAAKNGNVEVFKILLSYNPNLKAIDDRGKSAIHIAAENGRTECVRLIIASNKCSVHVTDFMWRTPLHLACVSTSELELAELLLENGADPNARDDRRWTPLLYVATRGCPCCTNLLVKYGAKINLWDKNRMTALSLAASNNNAKAVESLLEHGADPTILTCDGLSCMDIALSNRYHDVCMAIAKSEKWKDALVSCFTMERCLEYSPEVAKVILDRCIEYSGREIDKDYKVTYNFDLLDPHPDMNEDYYGPMAMKIARRNDLLSHPLTKKLLDVNWKSGVRYIYYTQMFLLAAAMVIITTFLLWCSREMENCYKCARNNYSNKSIPSDSPFFENNEIFCYEMLKNCTNYSEQRMCVMRFFIFAYFICYLGKELNQIRLTRWEYFLEITNYLDISVSVLFLMFVQLPGRRPIPYTRLKYGIMGIFSYYFLMFLWTRGLSRFGIYITMFLEVLATLLKVMSAFALLFLCFAVTFFVTFTTSGRLGSFVSFDNSCLKVMAMLMGELDYAGFRDFAGRLPNDMETVAILVFVIFCVTISLVVNNLLIGLAVGDIEGVRKNAEIKLLSLQVGEIVETRRKLMNGRFRRRFYVKTVTEMPNKHDSKTERRQKEYILRQQHKDSEKKFQII